MKKLRKKITKIKRNQTFLEICKSIEFFAYIFLFMQMVLYLGNAGEEFAQTHKDHNFGLAVICFLIALLILQKIKILNWVYIPIIIVFSVLAHYNLAPLEEMPHIYNVAKVRWIGGGLVAILLTDMIMYKKIALPKERNITSTVLWIVLAIGAFIISGGACYSYVLLFPIFCLYLMRIRRADFRKWIFALSIGYYLAFLYIMISSFVTVPYTGERYYGVYVNHGLFGIFIGGAFVCSLWWLLLLIKRKAPIWLKLSICVPIVFAIICSVINGARVGEFAILMVGIITICIWGGNTTKNSVVYRLVYVGLAAVILLICGFAIMYKLSTYERETLRLIIDNDILREKILYWCNKAKQVFGEESRYGIIEGGTIWNAIDQFSSGRLSHWIIYLQNTGMKPAENFAIDIGGFVMPHPHNTYIYWLFGMGIIPGIFLNVWIISYLVRAIFEMVRKSDICIFTFLWLLYYLFVGINENPLWISPIPFILLILQYPLMVKMKGKASKHKKGKING